MSVRLTDARQPPHYPETRVWLMAKGDRRLEARVRFLPIGDYRPELRIYLLEPGHEDALVQSMVLQPGDEFLDVARREQRAFEVQGWCEVIVSISPWPPEPLPGACPKCADSGCVCEKHRDTVVGHELADGRCGGAGIPCDCTIGRRLEVRLDALRRRRVE